VRDVLVVQAEGRVRRERPPTRAALRPEHARLLASVELFTHLDRVALSRFASYVEPVTVEAGAEVVRQGDEGRELYIVARGSFGIFACSPDSLRERRLGTLRAGDCFGEMALLTGEARSATVRADAEGELLELDRSRFVELMRREPEIALAIAAWLSRRLRATDQTILQREREIERALDRHWPEPRRPRHTKGPPRRGCCAPR
jgi:CRP-like cAMP-binding protein